MGIGFEERIMKAKQGRELWLKLVDKYHIDNTVYVILMPHSGEKYNGPVIKYLGEFLKKRGMYYESEKNCHHFPGRIGMCRLHRRLRQR